MKNRIKQRILKFDKWLRNINIENLEEKIYGILFVVGNTIVWVGWPFLNEDIYIPILLFTLILSMFIGTLFFPVVVIAVIYECLVEWSKNG